MAQIEKEPQNPDCKVCRQIMKEKHKKEKYYLIWAVIASILLAIFMTLYFATGELFVTEETTINNNSVNDVEINNGDGDNNNNVSIDNTTNKSVPDTTITTRSDEIFYIFAGIVVVALITGGIIIGYKTNSSKKDRD